MLFLRNLPLKLTFLTEIIRHGETSEDKEHDVTRQFESDPIF